jgi:hypothetical protein
MLPPLWGVVLASATCDAAAAATWSARAAAVCEWVRESWRAYHSAAAPRDTLAPVSRTGRDDFGALRATAHDALDTLRLCRLEAEYTEARALALGTAPSDAFVNVFETTIRVVGGLLGAVALDPDDAALRDKAHELGAALLPAFSDDGFVVSDVRMSTGEARQAPWGASSVSEAMLTPEFRTLSRLTGDARFARAAAAVADRLVALSDNGTRLLPVMWSRREGLTGDRITLGARGDSYYEYLFKGGCVLGVEHECTAFRRAAAAIRDTLCARLDANATFVDELVNGARQPKMDHLVCFLPGTLAWAVHLGVLDDEYLRLAASVFETCRRMHDTPTGLAAEIAHRRGDGGGGLRIAPADRHNLLRPETLESAFWLWKATRDEHYRHASWRIVEAFATHARAPAGGGFCSVDDVLATPTTACRDEMPSYWLAETLKYAYMTFADHDVGRRAVLSTEGHFLSD